MNKRLPWNEIRRCYEQEGMSCKDIAERFGAASSTVQQRARKEHWRALPALVHSLSDTASRALAALQQEEHPDVRAVKELTAVMRELANLEKTMENREQETVQVVLTPEIEEWSR